MRGREVLSGIQRVAGNSRPAAPLIVTCRAQYGFNTPSPNMLREDFFTQTDTARRPIGFSRWSRWRVASPQKMLGMAALLRERRSLREGSLKRTGVGCRRPTTEPHCYCEVFCPCHNSWHSTALIYMNLAQLFISLIGFVAAVVTFCLMRFPHTRRDPFRQYGAFSITASLVGAGIVLVLCALMVLAQGVWQVR
jgi:hypothetical protein